IGNCADGAFVWSAATGRIPIQDPSGRRVEVAAISNAGHVAGTLYTSGLPTAPFVWTAATVLGVVGPGRARAYAVNDPAQIVGGEGCQVKRVLRWAGFIASGSIFSSRAIAVNGGQVVGTTSLQAFYWTASGGLTLINSATSVAQAVTSHGQVIGFINAPYP